MKAFWVRGYKFYPQTHLQSLLIFRCDYSFHNRHNVVVGTVLFKIKIVKLLYFLGHNIQTKQNTPLNNWQSSCFSSNINLKQVHIILNDTNIYLYTTVWPTTTRCHNVTAICVNYIDMLPSVSLVQDNSSIQLLEL